MMNGYKRGMALMSVCAAAAVLLGGCAVKQSAAPSQSPVFVQSTRDKPAASPAMLVRNMNPSTGAVEGEQRHIDIFVNGMYLASLPPGATVPVAMCPGQNRVRFVGRAPDGAAQALGERAITAKAEGWYVLNLRGEQPTRFEAQEVALSAEQYTALFARNPALHTVSRVVNRCAQPAPVVPVAVAAPLPVPAPAVVKAPERKPETVSFQFNYLSDAHRLHDAKDIARLRALIERVKRDAPLIDRLVVVGHTDPMGSAAHNTALSKRRAQNIAAEITVAAGMPQAVQHMGAGPQNLVVTDCHLRGLSRAQEVICNAPNRRVDVLIYQK